MRIARVTPPGLVHHVISRFIDDRWFVRTDADRERYLHLLGRALEKSDWSCLAYAIMSSHLHLALIAGERPAESWSRRVNPAFARWLNQTFDRGGCVIASRASMWISRPGRTAELIAYIHNNPVRAGVVARAVDSTWTSHRAYVGSAPCPAWLDTEAGLERAGLARESFDAWVHGERANVLDEHALEPIRRAARKLGAIELGTPTRDPLEAMLVARPFAYVRPSPARIVETVAEVSRVPLGALRSHLRGEPADARAVAIRAGQAFGVSMSSVAAALGISPQAASRLAGRTTSRTVDAVLALVCDRLARDDRPTVIKVKASPAKGAVSLGAGGDVGLQRRKRP
jgi:hypothetical protein